jgi:hypothetical protein
MALARHSLQVLSCGFCAAQVAINPSPPRGVAARQIFSATDFDRKLWRSVMNANTVVFVVQKCFLSRRLLLCKSPVHS